MYVCVCTYIRVYVCVCMYDVKFFLFPLDQMGGSLPDVPTMVRLWWCHSLATWRRVISGHSQSGASLSRLLSLVSPSTGESLYGSTVCVCLCVCVFVCVCLFVYYHVIYFNFLSPQKNNGEGLECQLVVSLLGSRHGSYWCYHSTQGEFHGRLHLNLWS